MASLALTLCLSIAIAIRASILADKGSFSFDTAAKVTPIALARAVFVLKSSKASLSVTLSISAMLTKVDILCQPLLTSFELTLVNQIRATMTTFTDRLNQAMREADLSQADLHRKSGYTRAAISKWVNGQSEPKDILKLARILGVSPEWLQTGKEAIKPLKVDYEHNADFVGLAKSFRPVPVVGTAKLGDDGDYSLEQVDSNVVLDAPTSDPNACALRVVGDSMHPAIRHGWYVVIEPSIDPRHGLYVAVETHSGKRMVKELLSMDSDVVRLESVNPKHGRTTLDAKEVKTVQAVTMIVQASKARVIQP